MLLSLPLSLPLLLSLSLVPVQKIGGGWEMLYDHHAPIAGDFGEGLANAGDVNGDGYLDQIISAPGANHAGLLNAGAVYIYSGSDGSILQQYFGSTESLHLGRSVAGLGDIDGDGLSDIAIGTDYATPNGTVWVYSSITGAPLYQLFGDPVNGSGGYGQKIAVVGDVDGDAINDFLVSDPRINGTAGAAYLYSGATGTLIREHINIGAYDRFAGSTSPAGDVDADGIPDYIIGAKFGDHAGQSFGFANVYSGATGSLIHQFTSGPNTNYLGSFVASAGDVNGDGHDDLLIAAEGAIGTTQKLGSVFVFSGADGSIIHEVWGPTTDIDYAAAAVNTGDVDDDGIFDFLVGAPGWMNRTGKVFLYSGATGEEIDSLRGTNAQDHFGRTLAMGGDINQNGYPNTLIGAEGSNFGGSVEIWGPADFMTSSATELSASAGGSVDFALDFPIRAATQEYRLLASITGVGPTLYGVKIPLTVDQAVLQTWQGNYLPASANQAQGVLNADGDASAQLTFTAGSLAPLIGSTIYFAAVSFPVGELPRFSSVANSLQILP